KIIELINFSEAEPFYNRKKNFSKTRSVFFESTSIDVFLMPGSPALSFFWLRLQSNSIGAKQ
ncbi:hypothetical protein P4H83_15010, partial [Paenibacillus favisporus]|uniref:hypothetical protein n=1 Tax=Paenibacillus favisporus TaxID=221028 RepID=UPI002DB918A8